MRRITRKSRFLEGAVEGFGKTQERQLGFETPSVKRRENGGGEQGCGSFCPAVGFREISRLPAAVNKLKFKIMDNTQEVQFTHKKDGEDPQGTPFLIKKKALALCRNSGESTTTCAF